MAVSPYYLAYKNGYLCGEVERELGTSTGENFSAPPEDVNEEAFRAAQLWGHSDGLDGSEMRSQVCVDMHMDNEFAI